MPFSIHGIVDKVLFFFFFSVTKAFLWIPQPRFSKSTEVHVYLSLEVHEVLNDNVNERPLFTDETL